MTEQKKSDPSLRTLAILGLMVAIPVVVLLFMWGVFPAPVPHSRSVLF